MALYRYPMKMLTDSQILSMTDGEVEKLVDLILGIPEFGKTQTTQPIEDRLQQIIDFLEPMVKALDSDDEKDGMYIAAYSNSLERGYSSGFLDGLSWFIQQVDERALNEVQRQKCKYIGLAIVHDMDGLPVLLEHAKAYQRKLREEREKA